MGERDFDGRCYLPDGSTEPDASAAVERVLRLLYRLDIQPISDDRSKNGMEPARFELNRTVPQALLDAMEAEGLLAWIPENDDEPGVYTLTAEGRRVARNFAAGGAPSQERALPPSGYDRILSVSAQCVARQRMLVQRLEETGRCTLRAAALLSQFEASDALMRKTMAIMPKLTHQSTRPTS